MGASREPVFIAILVRTHRLCSRETPRLMQICRSQEAGIENRMQGRTLPPGISRVIGHSSLCRAMKLRFCSLTPGAQGLECPPRPLHGLWVACQC